MQQEGSGTMEKKPFVGQSSVQFRNNGVSGEKKCDKSGRCRRSNNGNRNTEVNPSPRPLSNTKWNRSCSDKRPRQRGSYDDRQREEVAEAEVYNDVVLSTGSRKGNANHLLNFRLPPRENEGTGRWGRGHHAQSSRNRGTYRKLPRYNKELYLQASCQFVVREGGEYFEQAVNPDALVNWDMIEQVKSFATETLTCPICIQVPCAGKITKCGHIYCWACILHLLKLEDNKRKTCPICYHDVNVEDLKSVEIIEVKDYSVGDEIEMKLMRKNKGSVQVMPKKEWQDRKGEPMNIQDGANTRFMKLLVASLEQIQKEVIDRERIDLAAYLLNAEESETPYIEMAQALLNKREASLKKVFKRKNNRNQGPHIPGLVLSPVPSDSSSDEEDEKEQPLIEATTTEAVEVTMHVSKLSKVYADAFEDEEKSDDIPASPAEPKNLTAEDVSASGLPSTCEEEYFERPRTDSESTLPFGSPSSPFPLSPDQPLCGTALSPEETAETLELPMCSPHSYAHQRRSQYDKPKDAYYFYQASNGQHIYLHSINAHCLTKEYGSLENSPDEIKATIVSIERCFMNEEVRKRLRYLNHIPLTCEFYVMELKFAPPIVSKETLRCYHAEFEKKRKARLRKLKDEKSRAKKQDVEFKKSYGIYPEYQIPLANLKQFPSHLGESASSPNLQALTLDESSDQTRQVGAEISLVASPEQTSGDGLSDICSRQDSNDSMSNSPGTPGTQGSGSGAKSFAQMLKAGKSTPQSGAWGRSDARTRTVSGGSSSGSRDVGDGSDGEDLPAPSYTASLSDAIEQAMNTAQMRRQSSSDQHNETPVTGGKKKKRKEKQLLFSTSMARKN